MDQRLHLSALEFLCIQKCTVGQTLWRNTRNTNNPDSARSFASLVTQGKIGAAISMLSDGHSGGLHTQDDELNGKTIRDILKGKHPHAAPLNCDNIVQEEAQTVPYSMLFASINRNTIKAAALNTQGAAGPSGMTADEWRRMCTSFKGASDALCDALASCARRIAIDPASLQAYVACRLIPLDKNRESDPSALVRSSGGSSEKLY